MMDGGLVLDDRWAAGCAFVLDLPAAAQPATADMRGAGAEPQLQLSGQEILLVEDRADTRDSMPQLLRQHGAVVTAFGGSDEVATALAEGLRPAAVITDWQLGPADNGAAVVAMVRAHVPGARILVISGDATSATEREVAATGCALLLKPASGPALLAALAGLDDRL